MLIKNLELINFRNLKHLQLSFATEKKANTIRNWTVILGENGTGKSNVLKAIALLTAGSDALGELLGNADDWIRYRQQECFIKATLIDSEKQEHKIAIHLKKGDALKTVMQRSFETLDKIDKLLKNTDYFVAAYGANRSLANQSRSNSAKTYFRNQQSNHVATLFHREAKLYALEDWAVDLDYRKEIQGLQLLKETLNRFLPDISFHSIDKRKRKLLFETIDGIFSLDYLSDGYQNMAAWLGDVLFRLTENTNNYSRVLQTKGILLIDELELHLHPKWQRHLIDFINQVLPNFQIICTTHSPITAQQAGENELYILNRDASQNIRLVPYLRNPQYMPINELLISNAFGLPTDESVSIENKKKRYQELKGSRSTLDNKEELEDLTAFLVARPLEAQNERKRQQMELLEQLLKNKK